MSLNTVVGDYFNTIKTTFLIMRGSLTNIFQITSLQENQDKLLIDKFSCLHGYMSLLSASLVEIKI